MTTSGAAPHGRLANKIAIVTGASSGIGRAICAVYASEGAKILVADISEKSRNPTESQSTVELVSSLGSEAIFVKVDVSNSDSVDGLVQTVVERWGRLDIMVNNAGIAQESGDPKPIWEVTNERWDQTMAVNATGVFYGVRAAARQMMSQEPHASGDKGWIINLASVLGLVGGRGCVSYSASKHTVIGITKAVAIDLGPHRIHVNALCPGYTRSSMTRRLFENPGLNAALTAAHPFRGLGETEDIARAALFLASDDARWVSGVGLPVDGGYVCQ